MLAKHNGGARRRARDILTGIAYAFGLGRNGASGKEKAVITSPRAHFDQQLQSLQDEVLLLTSMVDKAVDRSVEALKQRDRGASERVIRDDATINEKRFEIEERVAADGDDDFPVRSPAFRRGLRSLMRDGMPWYKLSDLDAEMRALARCWRGRNDVVHFLDGEHSGRNRAEPGSSRHSTSRRTCSAVCSPSGRCAASTG